MGGVVHLVCTLFDFTDVRLLALHRVQSAEIVDAPIRRPEGFDLDAFIAAGAFGFGGTERIKLVAVFEQAVGAHLYETPLDAAQTLTPQEDGCLRLTAHVIETEQLRWWLLSFGDGVEVVEPVALRRRMAETAVKMHDQYAGKDMVMGA